MSKDKIPYTFDSDKQGDYIRFFDGREPIRDNGNNNLAQFFFLQIVDAGGEIAKAVTGESLTPAQASTPVPTWNTEAGKILEELVSENHAELLKDRLNHESLKIALDRLTLLAEEKIIGKDDVQVWDDEANYCETCSFQPTDTTLNCKCIFKNRLRAEMRAALKVVQDNSKGDV